MIYADKTFVNGKIHTMVAEDQVEEALVVYDGKIVFVGSNDEAKKFPTKEIIDLQGKIMLPGFIDTHLHLIMDCQAKERIDLTDVESIDEIIDRMKKNDKGGEDWFLGANLHIEKLSEGRFPLRHELDEITTDRPVLLISYCRHAALANSKALEMAGITKDTVTKIEGLIDFDENGEPNGITRESSYGDFFAEYVEKDMLDPEYRRNLLKRHLSEYSEKGFTTLHTFTSVSGDPMEYLDQYMDLESEGVLPVRIVLNPRADMPEDLHPKTGFGTNMIKIGAKKIFSDGAINAHSAALLEPYEDAPEETGLLMLSEEELIRQMSYAYKQDMEIAVHAIGDRAMETVLNAIEAVYNPRDGYRHRFRIIHGILVKQHQIERMKKLPIILDVQPIFIRNWVHLAEKRVGRERTKLFLPFKSFIDSGVIVTGGSDAPVDVVDPFISIQCAVTRKDLAGYPESGFVPEQAISVYEGISLYTKNAAHCSNEEDLKGTLEVGKLADLVVLEQNIFEMPFTDIHKVKVSMTIMGGEITWLINE